MWVTTGLIPGITRYSRPCPAGRKSGGRTAARGAALGNCDSLTGELFTTVGVVIIVVVVLVVLDVVVFVVVVVVVVVVEFVVLFVLKSVVSFVVKGDAVELAKIFVVDDNEVVSSYVSSNFSVSNSDSVGTTVVFCIISEFPVVPSS